MSEKRAQIIPTLRMSKQGMKNEPANHLGAGERRGLGGIELLTSPVELDVIQVRRGSIQEWVCPRRRWRSKARHDEDEDAHVRMISSESNSWQRTRYSLGVRQIARGGMAELWDDGHVVLKRLRPLHRHDPEALWMLREEGRVLSTLDHPSIVQVHANREGELALERIDGIDADVGFRWGRGRAPVPAHAALHVVGRAAHALAYVASRGLVHRDVNPPNIMLERTGRIVLIDFGVVRDADREGRTATGVVKGKVAYLAPEQVRGEAVSPATDVYALGATLHALLSGESPVPDWAAMAERVSTGVLELDSAIEPGVAELIRAMMALEPSRRPRADAVHEALRAYSIDLDALASWVANVSDLARSLDGA